MIATADLVIDNMRPGALARMGLPDEELRRANPKLVAVDRARTTGIGGRVETSMLEASVSAFPWPVLVEASGHGPVVAVGNRDDAMSPHGVFACADADGWVALAVRDDDEFAALAVAIGRADLAADPRFADARGRRCHEDELEQAIATWAGTVDHVSAAATLCAAGVPAAPVARMEHVAASPELTARGFFRALPHGAVGARPVPGPAWVTSRSSTAAGRAAPCLGEHTAEVLREVLGLRDDEIASLADAGLLR